MYIVDELPPAGTSLLYRRNSSMKYHKAIIDSGIIITDCGIRAQLAVRYPQLPGIPVSNPNKDSLLRLPPQEILKFYEVCRKCG